MWYNPYSQEVEITSDPSKSIATDIEFTALDHNTIAWSSGVIVVWSEEAHSIVAGSTIVSWNSYIYFDWSSILKYTTDPKVAIASNNKIVVNATDNVVGKLAMYKVDWNPGVWVYIDGDRIKAWSVTAAEIDVWTINITWLLWGVATVAWAIRAMASLNTDNRYASWLTTNEMSTWVNPTNWLIIDSAGIRWWYGWFKKFEFDTATGDGYFRWNIYAEWGIFSGNITSSATITWWTITWSTITWWFITWWFISWATIQWWLFKTASWAPWNYKRIELSSVFNELIVYNPNNVWVLKVWYNASIYSNLIYGYIGDDDWFTGPLLWLSSHRKTNIINLFATNELSYAPSILLTNSSRWVSLAITQNFWNNPNPALIIQNSSAWTSLRIEDSYTLWSNAWIYLTYAWSGNLLQLYWTKTQDVSSAIYLSIAWKWTCLDLNATNTSNTSAWIRLSYNWTWTWTYLQYNSSSATNVWLYVTYSWIWNAFAVISNSSSWSAWSAAYIEFNWSNNNWLNVRSTQITPYANVYSNVPNSTCIWFETNWQIKAFWEMRANGWLYVFWTNRIYLRYTNTYLTVSSSWWKLMWNNGWWEREVQLV